MAPGGEFPAGQASIPGIHPTAKGPARSDKVVLSDAEWKRRLTPAQYEILRKAGTEAPDSSALNKVHVPGTFVCAGCGNVLFTTSAKFDSGTGWPSFVKPANEKSVWYRVDNSDGMARIEVLCAKCDGHLGHVFDDGPADRGGLRYCMDGDAMRFEAEKGKG